MIDSLKLAIYQDTYPDKILVSKSYLNQPEAASEDTDIIDSSGISFDFDTDRIRRELDLPQLEKGQADAHYSQFGKAGFFVEGDYQDMMQPELKPKFIEATFKLIAFIVVTLLIGSLSFKMMAMKQTRGKDDMLAYLPLEGWQILLGSFINSSLLRLYAWFTLFPILTWAVATFGHSFVAAASLALPLTILLSAVISGSEICMYTWLNHAAKKKVVDLAQKIFGISGTISLYLILALIYSNSFMLWSLEHIPSHVIIRDTIELVYRNPYPILTTLLITGAVAIISGVTSCLIAGRILDSGDAHSLNEQAERTLTRDTCEKKLWRFEVLALQRNRGVAAQIIILPFVFLFYQFLISPNFSEGVHFKSFCTIGFGCGAYACILTIQRLFLVEQQGLWIIKSLPIEVADYFSRRERIWRLLGAVVGLIVIISGIIWNQAFSIYQLGLASLSLIGLWIVGRVVNGVLVGNPKFQTRDDSTQVYKPNMSTTYLAMLLASGFAGLIHLGDIWPLIVATFIFWLLGEAIWERKRISFRYLLDPTAQPPKTWGIDSAMWLVVFFFLFQTIGLLIFLNFSSIEIALLLSFALGGICSLFIALLMNKKMNIPLPKGLSIKSSILMAGIHSISLALVCIAVAYVWISALRLLHLLPATNISLGWEYMVIAVVLAPLLEEPIFRGKVFSVMRQQWSERKALLISSLLFAVIHPGLSFLPVFCLGAGCAFLYRKHGVLWPAILMHAVYNLGVIAMS